MDEAFIITYLILKVKVLQFKFTSPFQILVPGYESASLRLIPTNVNENGSDYKPKPHNIKCILQKKKVEETTCRKNILCHHVQK